ncbi:angiotensin-converting enzyme-like [Dermatophagoides pteronyssinus]|uniref:angiotensin-converting enzyme-like n=1 Tax=Dermatophagoides pteronyssinus TaxID=6956 RepID=UPI003F671E28
MSSINYYRSKLLLLLSLLLIFFCSINQFVNGEDEIPISSTTASTLTTSNSTTTTAVPSSVSNATDEQSTPTTTTKQENSTTEKLNENDNDEGGLIRDENKGREFMLEFDKLMEQLNYEIVEASFNFHTNLTAENQAHLLEVTKKLNRQQKEIWKKSKRYDYQQFSDPILRRLFEKISVLGIPALEEQDSEKFTKISTELTRTYDQASICLDGKCGLDLDPDLYQIMAKSRDPEKLKHVWIEWRNQAGSPNRQRYIEYIHLGNKAAIANGFKTLDDLWLFPWETEDFKQQVAQLWEELKPYYQKIHSYVRMRLRRFYVEDRQNETTTINWPNDGTIPAHLLGNMWSQTWGNIYDLVVPYPGRKSLDVTEEMREQNYTAMNMFHLAEKFFKDLSLIPMPETFWKYSMFTKPLDRKVACHATAWDFYNRQDFRVKMCTSVTMKDLITVHHEMGHIQYYLQYKDQPVAFREGANPGFHEAVGDLLALSVSTPEHLKKINLLSPNETVDQEILLNYQLKMALDKLAFLPFGYLMDAYRWDLFSGKVSLNEMNKHWWWYRLQYQGISPPVRRNESDFDPAAKYHIPAGVEYIRYFVSFIIQFQFHQTLCNIAQPGRPLYQCDIDGNHQAGEHLAKMLRLGSSVRWPEAMKLMTGSERMSAAPLIEYFQPLFQWLDQQIVNETLGWQVNLDNYI